MLFLKLTRLIKRTFVCYTKYYSGYLEPHKWTKTHFNNVRYFIHIQQFLLDTLKQKGTNGRS